MYVGVVVDVSDGVGVGVGLAENSKSVPGGDVIDVDPVPN